MVIMCEYCNKEFKYPCFLERHLNNKNSCIKNEIKCEKCNKTFTQNWKYNLHKKRKTPCVKNYIKFNLDEKKIINKITKKTKAIIPVHLYGKTCNMDLILKIAKNKNGLTD